MAHHNNTPESVLKAPGITVAVISEHTGLNRRDRRKLLTKNGKLVHIPKHLQPPATNVSYIKPRKSDEDGVR